VEHEVDSFVMVGRSYASSGLYVAGVMNERRLQALLDAGVRCFVATTTTTTTHQDNVSLKTV
jgi:hypothetical protein